MFSLEKIISPFFVYNKSGKQKLAKTKYPIEAIKRYVLFSVTPKFCCRVDSQSSMGSRVNGYRSSDW